MNRHRNRFNSLNRQVERQHVQPVEALHIGIFERGLLPELFELQRIGHYNVLVNTAVYTGGHRQSTA